MNYTVHNYGLHIGTIDVTGIGSSSLFLIGDSETIRLHSFYDTPPESLIIGQFAPIEQEGDLNDE
ncbi:spore gernimation protein GerPD [Halobacillus shinanisalinarum]|uniref:Spore gernimation protein GerPD n=1 Tax=Halobacillus shinanisalinarum TaxID=2932258 RepID=A0ABY4GXW2_9BACI|nr:spore gernimation protein GerPD [Halobacillus shinanisalinarum]UOQ92796.1 spore gernimation protein GerPD [Halobacillus shinanisalinarum]